MESLRVCTWLVQAGTTTGSSLLFAVCYQPDVSPWGTLSPTPTSGLA